MRLTETETALPPILVDRRTMRVIDGMHRLMAASIRGQETIDVVFFDGSEADVFLRAVQENVTHGLPLSQTDRQAAAERIIASHPHMSDRAIGQAAGLGARTVASIRRRSGDDAAQAGSRVGRDGKVRPLDSGEGRRRAAELLADRPKASLRDIARVAGISAATVLDVRNRLARGDSPVRERSVRRASATPEPASQVPTRAIAVTAASASAPGTGVTETALADANLAQKLMRDPAMRGTDRGKALLQLLHLNAANAGRLKAVARVVPAHCVVAVMRLAQHNAQAWRDFACELEERARITDPRL
ncbi:transcriptional regulator [Streptomyces sp. NPDC088350]|uniref:ParB/RepB/Spo0J family partition protein n=1 Tax=Streptomyces sp. NPDC088350 TaxID=3365854 RepID=UPI00380E799F